MTYQNTLPVNAERVITNARVVGYRGLQQVAIAEDKIAAIAPRLDLPSSLPAFDLKEDWLSLGGVDLQINGALGLAFPELKSADLPRLEQICHFLWQKGIDSFLPTIVTTATENIQRSLGTIARFMADRDSSKHTARILGVHLEGPFLNYQKRGAHPARYLLPLTLKNIQRVLGDYAEIVKVMTLAPELDSSGETIAYLKKQDIIVSLGHSQATASEAKKAFAEGATMVTHAFNAMPSLHHRQPGLLGEAIVNSSVYCGLIADGNHVCPTMLEIILKASNYQQGVFLVSDALAPIGLPDGTYPWDERKIIVSGGTARLPDGTLSGTTLPLLAGAENLVRWGCNIESAIAMATESPRKAIDLPGLEVGQLSSLLRWHWDKGEQKLTWNRL